MMLSYIQARVSHLELFQTKTDIEEVGHHNVRQIGVIDLESLELRAGSEHSPQEIVARTGDAHSVESRILVDKICVNHIIILLVDRLEMKLLQVCTTRKWRDPDRVAELDGTNMVDMVFENNRTRTSQIMTVLDCVIEERCEDCIPSLADSSGSSEARVVEELSYQQQDLWDFKCLHE
jgi:hypothetical protein